MRIREQENECCLPVKKFRHKQDSMLRKQRERNYVTSLSMKKSLAFSPKLLRRKTNKSNGADQLDFPSTSSIFRILLQPLKKAFRLGNTRDCIVSINVYTRLAIIVLFKLSFLSQVGAVFFFVNALNMY